MAEQLSQSVHHFDADGQTVLEKRELRRENAILQERVEQLERLIRRMITRDQILGLDDLTPPTRH